MGCCDVDTLVEKKLSDCLLVIANLTENKASCRDLIAQMRDL
jgi:hypothetical protein